MKFRVKNVKDEIVMVLVDCESFMFRIKDPKFRDVLITQKFEYLKKGDEIEVELEFRNPDEDKKHLPGMYSPENAEGKMTISHAQTNRTIIVKNDTHCYKIYDPKEASPSDLIKFYEHQEEGLVTQKPQVLKKGEVVEVELEFRNPDEDKKHLPGVYSPENAEGKMTISHSDIGSFIYVRNIEVHEDEIGEPYDIENAPPNHLIAVCGVKRRITMLNMKEDTEESRKIKDVFGPIMLNKMRAESDGPSLDRKVLKKKNAKSKKKKKCCTIL
ncbi:hypothetical protein L3Y34_019855 [Caenorhabditis briggsae]|uniref:Uncharacterized protein n=1 Tax=Caenorhabditis briggsae TaxID=6238 RepID=A0AAE9DR17_CAEBR|nr:hypothetical protein L3Y34_019855 [Caenorhabditis briggsae]